MLCILCFSIWIVKIKNTYEQITCQAGNDLLKYAQMPKKMFIFRCPDAELAEIQRICADNRTDYTRVVNTALIMLTDRLAKEGVLPERELPPVAPSSVLSRPDDCREQKVTRRGRKSKK